MSTTLLSTVPKLNRGSTPAYTTTRIVSSFTSSGTFVTPNNVWSVSAIVIAGGGGGGQTNLTGNTSYRAQGGGGGGGSFVISTIAVYPGLSLTVNVGAGGAVNSQGGGSSVQYGATEVYALGGGTGGYGVSTGVVMGDFNSGSGGWFLPTTTNAGGGGGGGAGEYYNYGQGRGGPFSNANNGGDSAPFDGTGAPNFLSNNTKPFFIVPGWRCGSGGSGTAQSVDGAGGGGGGGLGPSSYSNASGKIGGKGIVYTFPSWTNIGTISACGGAGGGSDQGGGASPGWSSNSGNGAYWTYVPSVYTGYNATAGAANTGCGGGGSCYITGNGGGTNGGTNAGTLLNGAAGGSGRVIILADNDSLIAPGVVSQSIQSVQLPSGLLRNAGSF